MNHMGSLFQLGRVRARACARYGVLVVGEEMKGLVNCNFLPGSARRLELGTVSAEPLSRAYWSQKLRPLGETVGLSIARTSTERPDGTQAGTEAQTFCSDAPDGLSLAQFQPSPCRARTGRKNSGRSAKRLADQFIARRLQA